MQLDMESLHGNNKCQVNLDTNNCIMQTLWRHCPQWQIPCSEILSSHTLKKLNKCKVNLDTNHFLPYADIVKTLPSVAYPMFWNLFILNFEKAGSCQATVHTAFRTSGTSLNVTSSIISEVQSHHRAMSLEYKSAFPNLAHPLSVVGLEVEK